MTNIMQSVNIVNKILVWLMSNILWFAILGGLGWLAFKIIQKAREIVEEEELEEEEEQDE